MKKMKLTITVTEDILHDNPELEAEIGEVIEVEFEGDRPPKPPHNG